MADQKNPPEGAKDGLHKVGEIVEVIEEGNLVEIVDIEIYAKENKLPPLAKKYKFRIDRDPFTVEQRIITGEKLFELAQKSPAGWRMHQKLHGGHMKEIKVNDKIDLGEPGIERFVTMELTQGDGEQATATEPSSAPAIPDPRRQFRLPEDDEIYLVSLGLRWETVKVGDARWLFIHNHPVPAGYKQEMVTIAIRIEGGYPPGALDMAYFLPHLERADGKDIIKATPLAIDDIIYQQWSRHYTWRDGIDCLATHHIRVKNWLEVEPKR
jgi:hypothetical protein